MGVSVFETNGDSEIVFHDTTYFIKLAHENAKKDREIIQKKIAILAKEL